MNKEFKFAHPQDVFDCGDVLPSNCKKEQIGLGMVPDEKCEVFPTPYMDVIFAAGGEKPVPPTPISYKDEYLTFEILEDDASVFFIRSGEIPLTIEYSTDKENWYETTSEVLDLEQGIIPVPFISGLTTGDKVYVRGDNPTYCIVGNFNPNMHVFVVGDVSSGIEFKAFNLSGNIMSLIDSVNFRTLDVLTEENTGAFIYLFTAIEVGGNFSKLISCENLILPATTLAESCYSYMFSNCTSLTTAPELLATTLVDYCYYGMFLNCTSLTIAPVLPATTLANDCYSSMFENCSSLNYIKCLATDISATNCTSGWVNEIASSGTFVKHPDMDGWQSGESGIPENWTVEDAVLE